MSTDVLYARTTPDQKAAVDAYAESKGLKMNAAVVDLVSRGLASVAEEDAIRVRLEQLEADKAALTERLAGLQNQSQVLSAFVDQARGPAGTCPDCHHRVTGLDLLRTRCPKCGRALLSSPTSATPLDGQLVSLIGAAALLAGAIYLASKV